MSVEINEAYRLIGELAARVGGTMPDDKIDAYARDLSRLSSGKAATRAIRRVCDTWTGPGVPSWGVVLSQYQTEVRNEAMNTPALPSGGDKVIPPSEGRKVAARAYVAQCEREGREPSTQILDQFLGTIGDDQ